jgi:lysophospholipase L1-like esterase
MRLERPVVLRGLIWLVALCLVTVGALLAWRIRGAGLRSEVFWEPWDRLDGAAWLKPGLRDNEVVIPAGIISPQANAEERYLQAGGQRSLTFQFDTNEHRLRGGPLPEPREGVPRVVVIGGSVTFGWGVADDEPWPTQLEELLAERGHEVQVINGAMPGVWSPTSLLWCQRVAPELEPDLLIWARRPHASHLPPYDDFAGEIAACQQALDRPLLAVLTPVCSFDPLLRYWEEESRAVKAALERKGIETVTPTPAFRQAAQGRGYTLVAEGSYYVVYDQVSGRERLRAPIPPNPQPGRAPAHVWAPDQRIEGAEETLPQEELDTPAFIPSELPPEIYDLWVQDPDVHEVLFVDQGHLDAEGHRLLAEIVAEPLIRMLGELDQEPHAP